MAKPILSLDFDGVIHSYTSGWKGADVIADPPVPGAFQFIGEALQVFLVSMVLDKTSALALADHLRDHAESIG
jgi:hypothetical protein